jgi:hypothetical protein
METVYIYTLSDPRTKAVRYIGSTLDLRQRVRRHLTTQTGTAMKAWMGELRGAHLKPIEEIIDHTTVRERYVVERQWILCYLERGADLLNVVISEPIVPSHADPTLAPRWQLVEGLLRERPHTIKDIAETLQITPKTARSYLSEVSAYYDIIAEGPYGATRYTIKAMP